MTRNAIKNIRISLSAMALVIAAACSQVNDNMENFRPEDGMVSISVSLPDGMNTRSAGTIGDEVSASVNFLHWALFEVTVDEKGNDISSTHIRDYEIENAFKDSNETLKLNLPRDRKYRIALMAKHKASLFSSFSKGVMSVDYSKQTAAFPINDDVFVGKTYVIDPATSFSVEVTLRRPFAQINWGATDMEEAEVQRVIGNTSGQDEYGKSSHSIYNKLDILSNEVSDAVEADATYAMDLMKKGEYTFPSTNGTSCSLVAMRYILVDQTASSVINCKIAFTGEYTGEVEVTSAPVQANYRTNIYGRFFTDPNVFELRLEEGFISSTDIPANPSTPAE